MTTRYVGDRTVARAAQERQVGCRKTDVTIVTKVVEKSAKNPLSVLASQE